MWMLQHTKARKQNQSSARSGCLLCLRAAILNATATMSSASITAVTTITVVGDCVAINILADYNEVENEVHRFFLLSSVEAAIQL
jgi:hypothetical protein